MTLPSENDLERCICQRCPTFVKGDRRLFCLYGQSELQVVERGCICRTCPVHLEYEQNSRAFCLRGKAK